MSDSKEEIWLRKKDDQEKLLLAGRKLNESTDNILRPLKGNKIIAAVSTGKESIAMLSVLIEHGYDVFPVHRYFVKDLEFEEEVLQALENRFKLKILRLEEPVVRSMESDDVLMINNIWNIHPTPINWNKWDRMIRRMAGCEWIATGIRKDDSPIRRLTLTKHPNPNPKLKKVYPLADWNKKYLWHYIKERNLPISKAYQWFNRSLDCLNIKHVYPIKKYAPKDYEKIASKFPLLDGLMWLYEKRGNEIGYEKIEEC